MDILTAVFLWAVIIFMAVVIISRGMPVKWILKLLGLSQESNQEERYAGKVYDDRVKGDINIGADIVAEEDGRPVSVNGGEYVEGEKTNTSGGDYVRGDKVGHGGAVFVRGKKINTSGGDFVRGDKVGGSKIRGDVNVSDGGIFIGRDRRETIFGDEN